MAEKHLSKAPVEPANEQACDTPVAGGERLITLDFVRGIAVMGIVLANITAFAHPTLAYLWPGALPDGGNTGDRIVWLLQQVFVDGKFRGLFTILFGAGMYLFMERAWARGEGLDLQARRLFFLLLFGIAHTVFLFTGDILTLYALGGFLALPLVGWRARQQLGWGLAGYVAGSLLVILAFSSSMMLEQWPTISAEAAPEAVDAVKAQAAAWQGEAQAEHAVMVDGSYADTVRFRTSKELGQAGYLVWLALTETLPLMLVGMGLYRCGFFSGSIDRTKMWQLGWFAFLAGAGTTLIIGLWPYREGFPLFLTSFVASGTTALSSLPTMLGLAALLVLKGVTIEDGWLGERIIAAGRMAFSNYIGTSVVMMLVFQGWAGGLYGQLHRTDLMLPVLLVWGAMLLWSKPWLQHFRYGPLEWAWRCLTYGTRFPLRR